MKHRSTVTLKSDPTVVSLFSGAGGLDVGLEYAGFRHLLCAEIDAAAVETIRSNRPKWRICTEPDVCKLQGKEALLEAGVERGELTLLCGGPPCQPFSKAGFWRSGDTSRLKDPRSKTFYAFFRLAEEFLPEVLLLENVEGFAYSGKSEGVNLVKRRCREINKRHGTNYQPTIAVVDCAAYGLPQRRKRVVIVASRVGESFVLPRETHGTAEDVAAGARKFRFLNAWDAIGDLDGKSVVGPHDLKLTGKWADLLRSIPEGQNYLWHTPQGMGLPIFGWRTRYWSFLLKLAKAHPSWTVQASPGPAIGPFHWKNRRLSVRELMRLQGFPDEYAVGGSYRTAHRQIGNAVPPLVGEMLGRQIRRTLLGHPVSDQLRLTLRSKPTVPNPEREEAPPGEFRRKYRNRNPKAHPGVGLGPRAAAQGWAEVVPDR